MTIYTSLADRNTHLQGSELSNKSRSDSDSGCQQLDAAGDSTSNYVEKDLSKDAHQPSDHRDQHWESCMCEWMCFIEWFVTANECVSTNDDMFF